MKTMSLEDAKKECERWFAYLERQKNKSLTLQRIAAQVRCGEITTEDAQKQIRAIDNNSVIVFDGAQLEVAVKVLLKHIK